jgi:hypothetical protein
MIKGFLVILSLIKTGPANMLKSILLSILIVFILSSNLFAVWTDKEVLLTNSIDTSEGRITNRVYYKVDKEKAKFIIKKAIDDDVKYGFSVPGTVPGINPYAIFRLFFDHIGDYYKPFFDNEEFTTITYDYYCDGNKIGTAVCSPGGHIAEGNQGRWLSDTFTFVITTNGNSCVLGSGTAWSGSGAWETSEGYYIYNCSTGTGQDYVMWTGGGVHIRVENVCSNCQTLTPNQIHQMLLDSSIMVALDEHPEGFNQVQSDSSLVSQVGDTTSNSGGGGTFTVIPGDKPTVYTHTDPTGNTTNTTGIDPVTGDTSGIHPVTTDTTGPSPSYGNTDQPAIGNFDTTIEQPEDITKEQFKQKIVDSTTSFIANVPVVGAIYTLINNIHATSGACDLTWSFKGRTIHFNFCAYSGYFSIFRILIESCALLYGIMIFLKGA